MKNQIHIIGFLLLTALFFSLNTAFSSIVFNLNSPSLTALIIKKDNSLSTISFDLFNHEIQTVNVVYSSQNTPNTSTKNYSNFLHKSREVELSHFNSNLNNFYYTRSIEIQFNNTDIIFPFHTFL